MSVLPASVSKASLPEVIHAHFSHKEIKNENENVGYMGEPFQVCSKTSCLTELFPGVVHCIDEQRSEFCYDDNFAVVKLGLSRRLTGVSVLPWSSQACECAPGTALVNKKVHLLLEELSDGWSLHVSLHEFYNNSVISSFITKYHGKLKQEGRTFLEIRQGWLWGDQRWPCQEHQVFLVDQNIWICNLFCHWMDSIYLQFTHSHHQAQYNPVCNYVFNRANPQHYRVHHQWFRSCFLATPAGQLKDMKK